MKITYESRWNERDEKLKNASCSAYVGRIKLGDVYCIVRDTEIIPVSYEGFSFLKDRLIDELLLSLNDSFNWDIQFHLNEIDGIA